LISIIGVKGQTLPKNGSKPHKNMESLLLDWPSKDKWKVVNNQENEGVSIVELVHEGETLEKWNEKGTMMSFKGIINTPVDAAMNSMYGSAQEDAINPKLIFIEKNDTAKRPWIIFKIESAKNKKDNHPESELWFVIQGRDALFTNSIAIKKKVIPEDLKKKWIAFFKTSKLVYE